MGRENKIADVVAFLHRRLRESGLRIKVEPSGKRLGGSRNGPPAVQRWQFSVHNDGDRRR